MTLECLKSHKRKQDTVADWSAWMAASDNLYTRYFNIVEESPFYHNETASVSFLGAAAAVAGFLPLCEYNITKRGKTNKRLRVRGRADLWFRADARCYFFEFKTAYIDGTQLKAVLDEAKNDIDCILSDEYHFAAAGLIARVRDREVEEKFREFAMSKAVDFAYRIGPEGPNGAYLFFKLVA